MDDPPTPPPPMYLAGMGMITAIGADTAMTAAAVRARVSGYQASRFFTQGSRQPITLARVPSAVFESPEFDIDEGSYHNSVIIMALIALREALTGHTIAKPITLILATPEPNVAAIDPKLLTAHLVQQKDLPLHADRVRVIDTGRAAGIEGLVLAHHLLTHQKADYVLIGGSDSYANRARLRALEQAGRLLTPGSKDGFAPGEGAGFLLLTATPDKAMARGAHRIALCHPASDREPGHLYSDEPCRGEGLDRVFKTVLSDDAGDRIDTIYASLNGERYWAKEYGVAFIRNKDHFRDPVNIEHPADGYGDLGSATAPVLIALAAERLFKHPGPGTHLVYSASDSAARAAVRVEKVPIGA